MREDQRLLHGAIDTHIHASPSLFPRVCDHIECARGAASVGMRGVVFKIHHGDTSGRIPIVREVMGDAIEIYGGITLNSPVGGFNPFAVDTAIKMGAKMVWMPTINALNHLEKLGAPHFPGMKQVQGIKLEEKGLTIFSDEKRTKIHAEVRTICKLIGDAGICLSTGHLSVEEVRALIPLAKEEGVKHIIVQHPEYIVDASIEQQVEFAKMGAYIEHLAIFCFTHWGAYPTDKNAPAHLRQGAGEDGEGGRPRAHDSIHRSRAVAQRAPLGGPARVRSAHAGKRHQTPRDRDDAAQKPGPRARPSAQGPEA